jgi:hypothetical protein
MFAFILLLTNPAEPVSYAELEQAALDARHQIKSAELHFQYTYEDFALPAANQKSNWIVWLEGKRIRCDVTRTVGPNSGSRLIDCVNCEKDGWGISGVDDGKLAITFAPLGQVGWPGPENVFDPRMLGYRTGGLVMLRYGQVRLDSVIGSADRDEPVASDDRLNGIACRKLSWKKRNGAMVRVWLAPSLGHSVLRIEVSGENRFPPEGGASVQSEFPSGKIDGAWFPNRVLFEAFSKGKLERREELRIDRCRLNEAVAPDVFTFRGLGLPEGTRVVSPDKRLSGYLRDGKIDNKPQDTSKFLDETPPAPITPQRRYDPWLIVTCVVCAIAAIGTVVLRRRKLPS